MSITTKNFATPPRINRNQCVWRTYLQKNGLVCSRSRENKLFQNSPRARKLAIKFCCTKQQNYQLAGQTKGTIKANNEATTKFVRFTNDFSTHEVSEMHTRPSSQENTKFFCDPNVGNPSTRSNDQAKPKSHVEDTEITLRNTRIALGFLLSCNSRLRITLSRKNLQKASDHCGQGSEEQQKVYLLSLNERTKIWWKGRMIATHEG